MDDHLGDLLGNVRRVIVVNRALSILGLCICVSHSAVAENVEFFANSNRIVLEVPDGLDSVRTQDVSAFYEWSDTVRIEDFELHDILNTRVADQWDPWGRRIDVRTHLRSARVWVRPEDWEAEREGFFALVANNTDPDMYELRSREELLRFAASEFELEAPTVADEPPMPFVGGPYACAAMAFFRYELNENERYDRIYISLLTVVNGVFLQFAIFSAPVTQSNLLEETEWLIRTANQLVEKSAELNPHTFGEWERARDEHERNTRVVRNLLVTLAVTFLATYLVSRYIRKRSSRTSK